jgi:hypothetical protein
MTTLDARTSRMVWLWCVAYTTLVPREQRERRRIELRGHLHESERAGRGGRAVLGAAVAGIPDDVSWSFGLGLRRLARSFLTPLPYLVAAAILPVQGAFYWGARSGHIADVGKGISEVAAVACLALAGLAWLVRRPR